jgi:hypothetical protein
VQHDLTLRDAIARRYFYVWRDRWSFRTAKTLTGRSQTFREILDRMEPRGVAEFRSILYRGRKAS